MAEWNCVAYGPDLPGNHCFFEQSGRCADLAECQSRMAEEQKRVFRGISELSAQGDPDFASLEESFDKPTDLLFPPDQDEETEGTEGTERNDDQ